MKTLRDYFPRWREKDGIFAHMHNTIWDEALNPVLDIMFFTSHGRRCASDLTESYTDTTDIVPPGQAAHLADYIHTLYRPRWERLWAVHNAEYVPTENYNMEEISAGTTHTEGTAINDTDTSSRGGPTTTVTRDTEDTTSGGDTTWSRANTYAFNQDENSDGSPAARNEAGQTLDTHVKGTGTVTTEVDDASTGKSKSVLDDTRDGKTTHQLTRHGNIGVTTTQQMLQSEIALWQWRFFEEVFSDVASELAIPLSI